MVFVFNCKYCGALIGMLYTKKNKLVAVEWDSLNDIERKILTSDYKWGLTFEQGKHRLHICTNKRGEK